MISALHTGWLRWEGWLDWKGAGSNPSSAPPALGIFISPLMSQIPVLWLVSMGGNSGEDSMRQTLCKIKMIDISY